MPSSYLQELFFVLLLVSFPLVQSPLILLPGLELLALYSAQAGLHFFNEGRVVLPEQHESLLAPVVVDAAQGVF